jgi:hypothetical protein
VQAHGHVHVGVAADGEVLEGLHQGEDGHGAIVVPPGARARTRMLLAVLRPSGAGGARRPAAPFQGLPSVANVHLARSQKGTKSI